MWDFLADYGSFLAKVVTVLIAILLLVAGISAIGGRNRKQSGQLTVKKLNDDITELKSALQHAVLDKLALKNLEKEEKKAQKEKDKASKKASKEKKTNVNKNTAGEDTSDEDQKPSVFVLDFDGDIKASGVDQLAEEITAVLSIAQPKDEVVLKLESPGGMVHSYGLAASQLQRFKNRGIPLTICVDRVAASGGYMMACVANKILAAPFAVIGSIGVVAQVPNFNRLLKKNDIDYEVFTAGDYKRTVTMFGENTDKGKEKFVNDLHITHDLFKSFVKENRDVVNIDTVANGDVWYGTKALEEKLVDGLKTSDEYLVDCCENANVFYVRYEEKKTLQDKLGAVVEKSMDKVVSRWMTRINASKYFS